MKILLIYPYCLEARIHVEDVAAVPMGVYYVGALLKADGFDVEVLNWYDMSGRDADMRRIFEEKRPAVIGLSVLSANRWGAVDIARIAKGVDPGVRVVCGGIGASLLWRHLLSHVPEIDAVVVGEGEYPMRAIANRVAAGRGEALFDLAGVACRRNGRVFLTPPDPPVADLDALPNPARYFSFPHVALSRGCPGGCTFCGSPGFWGRRVRFHSADWFVAELQALSDRGVRFFYVSDDTFTLRRQLVIDVCRQIVERRLNITWAAISRVDAVDAGLLKWMRLAGCIQISYGVESGSPGIRKRLGKPLSNAAIQRAFALTASHGILTRAYFIYGCPGENAETIRESRELIRAIGPLSAIFYILALFPGTALYDQFLARTGVSEDALWQERIEDLLYYQTDPTISADDVRGWGKDLRTFFYRHLPEFVAAVDLVADPEMAPFHADFCSRLAMTFDHGDYAGIPEIPNPGGVAEGLYRKALGFAPDPRAYLGLGIRLQKQGAVEESIRLLEEAAERFPGDAHIHICLGVSRMNAGDRDGALKQLMPFKDHPQAAAYIAAWT